VPFIDYFERQIFLMVKVNRLLNAALRAVGESSIKEILVLKMNKLSFVKKCVWRS